MSNKKSLTSFGFIAALVILVLMFLVGNSQAQVELGSCEGILKGDVKMYKEFSNALPLWYEPTEEESIVSVLGKVPTSQGVDYYLVHTGRYKFWTPETSMAYVTECNYYVVKEFSRIKGWGCSSAYDPQAVHKVEFMPQDGRTLGYDGTGWTLTNGWGYVTFQDGEWRLTPQLEDLPGTPNIEVIHTSFSEECLADLPQR